MKRLALLAIALLLIVSGSAFAERLHGTATLNVEVNAPLNGHVTVMDYTNPLFVDLGTRGSDNSATAEQKLRVRHNGPVALRISSAPELGGLDYTFDVLYDQAVLGTYERSTGQDTFISLTGMGEKLLDLRLTINDWNGDNWWNVAEGTYTGNFVFEVHSPQI